jgi:hypothetical protein
VKQECAFCASLFTNTKPRVTAATVFDMCYKQLSQSCYFRYRSSTRELHIGAKMVLYNAYVRLVTVEDQ